MTYQQIEAKYPGLVAKLGTMADRKLARQYDISDERIRQFREALGIMAYRARSKYEARLTEIRPLLGIVPDTELAERFGVMTSSIWRMRKMLGIPPFRRSSRLKEVEEHLGQTTDYAISKRFGIPGSTVRVWRLKYAMPRSRPNSRKGLKLGSRRSIEERYPGITEALETMRALEVARRFGLATTHVYVLRRKLGIKAPKDR